MDNKRNIFLDELMEKYGLFQKDIAGNIKDRSTMSRILNGETKLSLDIAVAIANNIIIKVGNNLKEDNEYLYLYFYNNEKYKVVVDTKKYIEVLSINYEKNQFEKFFITFNDLENILLDNDIPEIKVKAYELAANICNNNHDYTRAYSYTFRAIDNVERLNDFDKKISLFSLLVSIQYYTKKYSEVINICNNLMNKYGEALTTNQLLWMLYNSGQAYKETDQFELALNNFNRIKAILGNSNIKRIASVLNSIAICYKKQKLYNAAISTLNELLDLLSKDHPNESIMTYDTLLEIYIETKNYEEIEHIIEKMLYVIPHVNNALDVNNHHISVLYRNIADAYNMIGIRNNDNYDFAEFYYNRAIETSKDKHDLELQYDCLLKLFEMHHKTNKKHKIELIVNNLYDILTKYSIDRDNIIVYKILDYFTTSGQIDKISDILKYIISKEEILNEK